jgi:hypothetical protein
MTYLEAPLATEPLYCSLTRIQGIGCHIDVASTEQVRTNMLGDPVVEVVADMECSGPWAPVLLSQESDMQSPCVLGGPSNAGQYGSCCCKNLLDSQTPAHLFGARKANCDARDYMPEACSRAEESSKPRCARLQTECMK